MSIVNPERGRRGVMAALACAALVVTAVVVIPSGEAASTPAGLDSARRCHVVVKRVHGKRRHVRVCPKSKPKPKPKPPSGPPQAPPPPAPVGSFGTIASAVTLPAYPTQTPASFGEGAVWVRNTDGSVTRFDPGSGSASLFKLPLTSQFGWVEAGGGAVWADDSNSGTVVRLDPTSGAVTARTNVPTATGIAIAAGSVWVAAHRSGEIDRLDPTTAQVVEHIQVPVADPQGLFAAAGYLWYYGGRINLTTHAVTPFTFPVYWCGEIGGDDTQIWLVTQGCGTGTMIHLDPVTATPVGSISVGDTPVELLSAFGSLWVNTFRRVVRVDPASGNVIGELDVPTQAIVAGAGSIWVIEPDAQLVRIQP
jgi:streptogramin lyase